MKKKLEKSLGVVAVLLFLAACAALYIYIYVIPDINGALTPTAVLNYESRQLTSDARCIVIRSEQIIKAGEDGTVSYYADENVKTRKGAKAVDVYPSDRSVVSYVLDTTGVVSYYVDGYESYFTPDSMYDIDPSWAMELDVVPDDIVRDKVESGQALYKLVTQDTWYMALIVDDSGAQKFKEGQNITVAFGESEDDQVKSSIISMEQKGTKWLIIAEAKRYYEPYLRIRTCDVSVISTTYSGLNVPVSAITQDENGCDGVMVKQIDNSYKFVRIKAVTQDDESALVKQSTFTEQDASGETVTVNTVKLYDEILRNADDYQKPDEPVNED